MNSIGLFNIHEYPPLVSASTHTTRLARRWTGTHGLAD